MKSMATALVKLGIVEKKFVLKKPQFGKVADLNPDSKSINLELKVVSCKSLDEKERGLDVFEVVAGDSSGIVTLRTTEAFETGKTLAARNCFVKMMKGYIRVLSGKWGKIAEEEATEDITPNEKVDVSSTEYELVQE